MFRAALYRFTWCTPYTSVPLYQVPVCRISTAKPLHYEFIKTEKKGEKENVALIHLNRPRAFNSLSIELMTELGTALKEFDQDDGVGAVVITGSKRAFAAGADIPQMQNLTYMDCYLKNIFGEQITSIKSTLSRLF